VTEASSFSLKLMWTRWSSLIVEPQDTRIRRIGAAPRLADDFVVAVDSGHQQQVGPRTTFHHLRIADALGMPFLSSPVLMTPAI
jgi:hypothetical protein